MQHRAGWLNRLGRDLGVHHPLQQTVRAVCAECNGGWMSDLEAVASRVLPSLVLGEKGVIEPEDTGAIAAWIQKTAMVAMLVSSAADRAAGYGIPASEYGEMFARREGMVPLPHTQFWFGRFAGETILQQVTPLVVRIDDQPEPQGPHAYLMTLVLGQLALQGVRFTTAAVEIGLSSRYALSNLWPAVTRAEAPPGAPIEGADLLAFCGGRGLTSTGPRVHVGPWRRATDLPDSTLAGPMVELPTICGDHVVYCPSLLARLAQRGVVHAFVTSCDCGVAYLVSTEADGAHIRAAGDRGAITTRYHDLAGEDIVIRDAAGTFDCKRLGPN